MAKVLERIRELIREGRYEITAHAWDEALDDDLHRVDIESAILTGRIRKTERGDPRGTRYVIEGMAADLKTSLGIVARFKPPRGCAIITVYEIED